MALGLERHPAVVDPGVTSLSRYSRVTRRAQTAGQGLQSVGCVVSRLPGVGLDARLAAATLDMAQFAARPLMISVCLAVLVAAFMRETYPRS